MHILLPPSEWKKIWWIQWKSSIEWALPLLIAKNASEKDLKCTGKRYEEWIFLNKNVYISAVMPAIERYTWVMFSAIDYFSLKKEWKRFFDMYVRIVSWMYWLIKPRDYIANYKLPVDTKWLRLFWWEKLTQKLQWEDFIIDLLPLAHKKYINFQFLETHWSHIVHCDFFDWEKKLTHWVKWAKWYRVHIIAELGIKDYKKRPIEFRYKWKTISVRYT